eukprot:363076-Chlamydomonas_euryale.AAC.9
MPANLHHLVARLQPQPDGLAGPQVAVARGGWRARGLQRAVPGRRKRRRKRLDVEAVPNGRRGGCGGLTCRMSRHCLPGT